MRSESNKNELLGEAYDLIQDMQMEFKLDISPSQAREIADLLEKINQVLYQEL